MATTSRNTAVKETFDHVLAGIPIVATQAINQGDIVCWDTSLNSGNGGLRTVTSQADMATYMGTADAQNPISSLNMNQNSLKIRRGGVVKMHTSAGETYKMFTVVYYNETADAQTITSSTATGARTVPVGYIILPQEQVDSFATFTLAGAAGVDVQVWLTPHYPVATI